MTVKIPGKSLGDKLLAAMGKRRAILVPDTQKKLGPYAYAQVRKEPFFRALLRPRNAPPPNGWIYVDNLTADECKTAD